MVADKIDARPFVLHNVKAKCIRSESMVVDKIDARPFVLHDVKAKCIRLHIFFFALIRAPLLERNL